MRAVLLLILWLLPGLAAAQGTATLVSDSLSVEGEARLVARGNVEVFYGGTRLTASEIVFDRAADRLSIAGPIFIQDGTGAILTADAASLDPKLENGILRSARLVLDQQLQLAANQISRAEGRYAQLYKVAASSCNVCGNRPPLWDIRAERVIHDAEARQLYFTNATLRLRGVPVFWLPRMRLPDPTLDRAAGFLIPSLRTTDQLSTGVKTPYFIPLGPSRDITLTPYLSAKTRTLEARYRQAFRRGDLTVTSAVSNDTLRPDDTRAYLFADGSFALGGDYTLTFGIEAVSDRAYLLDYGYSSKDRLESGVTLTRVRDDDMLSARLSVFQSLRAEEPNASLPPVVADFAYARALRGVAGGTLRLAGGGDVLVRTGDDGPATQRDLARLGLAATWDRRWTGAGGLVADAQLDLRSDLYRIAGDPAFPAHVVRSVPAAGLRLSYPLIRRGARATHLLTPAVALSWSDAVGGTPPNEDSTRAEFDAANLYALSRFPGQDAVETGVRLAAGLTWARAGADGGRSTLTMGRVWRDTAAPGFTRATGLDGAASDWLVAGQVTLPQGLHLEALSLLGDDGAATLTSARVNWQDDRVDLSAAYIWQAPDPARARPGAVSEWSLDTRVAVTQALALSTSARYDLANERPARAGLGLEWRNECMVVDLSVSRRYTTSTAVDPSTDYGLSVVLNGFSAGRSGARPATRCN